MLNAFVEHGISPAIVRDLQVGRRQPAVEFDVLPGIRASTHLPVHGFEVWDCGGCIAVILIAVRCAQEFPEVGLIDGNCLANAGIGPEYGWAQ